MTDEPIFWYQLDPAQRAAVADRFRGDPLSSLGFSRRVYNALRRSDARMDVAQLMLANTSIAKVYQLGPLSLTEINERLLALFDGSVPLEIYVPPAPVETHETIKVQEVQYLPEPVSAEPLGLLRLSGRSVNALREQGITTIGQLERTPDRELIKIEGVGQKSVTTVRAQIVALYPFVQPDGTADWNGFWQALGIRMLPDPPMPMTSVLDLVRALPKVIEQLLAAEDKERQWHMVQRRYGLGGVPKRTLDELGQAFDLTRERVRQLTSKAVDTLSAVLLEQDYADRPYQVDPALLSLLADVLERIRTLAAPGMLARSFRQALLQELGLTEKQLDSVDDLLFAFVGLRQTQFRSSHLEPIVTVDALPLSFDLEQVVPAIYDVLERSAQGMLEMDLLIEINKSLPKGKRVRLEDLGKAIALCSTAEIVDDNLIRCRFAYLRTRGDQIERILSEIGKPMTLNQILRTINQRLASTANEGIGDGTLGNMMRADGRFEPIGRSGEWALVAWGHETATITKLMRQFLDSRNEPATASEIAAYVLARRTASEASIAVYLQFDKSFVEISRGQWGLAHWTEARSAQTWNREQVAAFVDRYFRDNKLQSVEYRVLKAALAEKAGVSENTAAGLLARNPAISSQVVASRRIAVFQPNYQQALQDKVRFTRRKKTFAQSIGEDIANILGHAPGKQMTMTKLVAQLQTLPAYSNRAYRNLHSYIARQTFVERYRDPDSGAVLVRIKDAVYSELAAKALTISNEVVRSEVLRAIALLNVENVDVGLFQLSRQFETTLKRYVEEGERLGAFSGQVPADKKLVNLIAFVSKERLVEDKPTLEYLRQSRNERAHGAAPSPEQRQLMMNHVTSDAGKYIDYIKYFDGRTQELLSK